MRRQALQEFLDVAREAYFARTSGPTSAASIRRIFAGLETVAPQALTEGNRLPVCGYLNDVNTADAAPDLRRLMQKFSMLEPFLQWRRREGDWTGASANFGDNHANAIIVGPGGLEPRTDVWLGVSLLGPEVLYPEHTHAPEETYLVIGPGDFRQGSNEWVHVSRGETYYNPHNIVHAMRSSEAPLLVFWALSEAP